MLKVTREPQAALQNANKQHKQELPAALTKPSQSPRGRTTTDVTTTNLFHSPPTQFITTRPRPTLHVTTNSARLYQGTVSRSL
ncbi:hypothetical protein XELAEV_18004333mg [Xenopus laevis]|uniref:Uncharacterized protein n=1 Tax=Xenopus laevis TaxID=8355 RepID=A0A974BPR3_XENLA|nr:hypothetical protein XELAEV_18004333mg [Xenopus laevis]